MTHEAQFNGVCEPTQRLVGLADGGEAVGEMPGRLFVQFRVRLEVSRSRAYRLTVGAQSADSHPRIGLETRQHLAERSDDAIAADRCAGANPTHASLESFLGCLGRAFDATETTLAAVLRKARFWERHAQIPLNLRQREILSRLLAGFEGKLTTTKWAGLSGCSHDTALRDIQELIQHGVLKKDESGGRSTSYSLRAD